jgi:hypothetical protein
LLCCSVDDIVAWVAARKANYPTKARVEAKKAADQARRAEVGEDHKPIAKVDKHEEKAEKLRRQLAKVERKLENKRKREANDEGDEMRVDGTDSDSSDSDDEKPEVLTSRKQSSFLPPPPITRADPTNHCKYYSTGGICGKKSKCRFVHDKDMREQALLEQAANGGRMTLKQRLMRNDKETEDLAVIQSIVTLRASGKLVDAGQAAKTSSVTPNTSRTHPPTIKTETVSKRPTSTGQTRLPPANANVNTHSQSNSKVMTIPRDLYRGLVGFGNVDRKVGDKEKPRLNERQMDKGKQKHSR